MVSILVFVEVSLRVLIEHLVRPEVLVSILVFVEVSLRVIVLSLIHDYSPCFNPCFRGSIS